MAHSLPGLGVCWSRDELLQTLREEKLESGAAAAEMGEKESQNRIKVNLNVSLLKLGNQIWFVSLKI